MLFATFFARFAHRQDAWQELLGYKPKDLTLYELSLTHKSVRRGGNERLEFLGDAVLSLVIAKQLYVLFPKEKEGTLTRMRSRIVCRENLNKVAREMGLDSRLHFGQQIKSNAENVYGNALEALIGAIYLEAGYKRAEQFILRHIVAKDKAHWHKLLSKEVDFKSRLLEWGQAHHKTITFTLVNERYNSTEDKHTFVYAVEVDGKKVAQGSGQTKLESQQLAAKKALRSL